ncbi:hypothetical protein [Streptomyces galbus]|jgi:hypothetical protein|uniref:STAS domain-containing protein n=1 Tax=Streptomyces galbus TaxID=33898 RepID=A0A4U5X4S6_STRGB|nr:hypothetical protein [Streptomyces galbus]NKQ24784.1 hypothetical protein [Streptomyces galbus]TKT09071.1 hypothetical protein E4U92_15970 [Streptomyces galbus]GHD26232.1 hypothetical protein GCM10010335_12390 [Streptomyces galbus]
MLSHSLDRDVLVLTVHDDVDADGRGTLYTRISDLVQGCRPSAVVIVLDGQSALSATVGVVLRVQRLCCRLGILLSVAAASAPVRRLLETNAEACGIRLVIHARADTAVATAYTAAA